MTKNDMIARLNELSISLEREISTEGTSAELELRLNEAEEEWAAMSDDTHFEEQKNAEKSVNGEASSDHVTVRAIKTLHMHIFIDGRRKSELVKLGRGVDIAASELADLKGLVVIV